MTARSSLQSQLVPSQQIRAMLHWGYEEHNGKAAGGEGRLPRGRRGGRSFRGLRSCPEGSSCR